MDNDTIFSITAHIDLLGFSSHLVLSSYDLRTRIGTEAIGRLKSIENAISLIEIERKLYSEYFPETFRYIRFNDSLILGIDINYPILPTIGNPNKSGTFSYEDVDEYFSKIDEKKSTFEKMIYYFSKEAFKVAQFIGIASRIHNFINDKEFENHLPGCRTIITSGLRYRFIKANDEEDFYSANFSLSNAYMANEQGGKVGFKGNKCYLEDNVASIANYSTYLSKWIGYSKYLPFRVEEDPYLGKGGFYLYNYKYEESSRFTVDFFNKPYNFREINTHVSSNFQLFPHIIDLIKTIESKEDKDSLSFKLIHTLLIDTPTLKEINDIEHPNFEFPILFLACSLESDIKAAFEQVQNN